MAAGYLYVLVNSSMPGLVKVGKTTRSAAERADELSTATGVATPFIVVYDRYFGDCDAAEAFVHAKLSTDGLRQSHNREFFRASVTEVLNVILSLPGAAPEGCPATGDLDDLLTADSPEFADLRLAVLEPPAPWASLLEEGDNHYYGHGEYLADLAEAMKCYRAAARMGSAKAYERLGDMYSLGEGVRENAATAFELYKEGAKKGNYRCYQGMAIAFINANELENAKKCILRVVEAGGDDEWKTYQSFRGDDTSLIFGIISALARKVGVDHQLMRALDAYIPAVVTYIRDSLGNPATNPDPESVGRFGVLADRLEKSYTKALANTA